MKELEQLVAQSRAKWRGLRARIPMVSRGAVPVRLVLNLDDTVEEFPAPSVWKEALVSCISWLGPTRICLKASSETIDAALDFVRFAHRLECPTHLVTSGPVSPEEALSFVDRGLGAVTIRIAGLDEATQQAVLSSSLEAAANALHAFAGARKERSRRLALLVNVPLHERNIDSLSAIAGWTKQAGADAVGAGLIWGDQAPEGALAALSSASELENAPAFEAFLSSGQSPPQGLRAVFGADGFLRIADGEEALGDWREHSPEALWRANASRIKAGHRASRGCDEVELLPVELVSTR